MLPANWGDGWPNVWLGVTTENQAEADRRIPILQSIPAVVRFLSAEPLLEQIAPDLSGIHWVIVGGESGIKRRPVDLAWMRSCVISARANTLRASLSRSTARRTSHPI